MRIRGSGSGFGGFFGFGGGGGSRSDSFKQGRKPGQKVRGKLLKWVSDNMAWVEIEGHKLLAQLNSRHQVGAILTFVIKQLEPDIVLKEVFDVGSVGTNALTLASSFEAARTLFENNLRPHIDDIASSTDHNRLSAFIKAVSNDEKLLTSYLDTIGCIHSVNHHVEGSHATLLYQPWIIPTARRHISLVRTSRSGVTESITEFDLSNLGMVRIEFLHKGSEVGFKLKLQNTAKADELKRYLFSRDYSSLTATTQCLGISKLPQSGHGGILAETMFQR